MNKAHDAVWAALAGDALALGIHWIYDVKAIQRQTGGTLGGPTAPGPSSHHRGKQAGDFTHYGDQTLWLLTFMAQHGSFDPAMFVAYWRSQMASYTGYFDGATKRTLSNLDAGWGPLESGSNSVDLAGAVRFAGLLPWYADKPVDELAQAAVDQTRLTHNQPNVLAAADFLARLAALVLAGSGVREGLNELAGSRFSGSFVGQMVAKGLDSVGTETVDAISSLGQTCHVDEALPSVVHLLARHVADPAQAMIESCMAGGDSAARNMAVGLVLGAKSGIESLPRGWLNGIRAHASVEAALSKAP